MRSGRDQRKKGRGKGKGGVRRMGKREGEGMGVGSVWGTRAHCNDLCLFLLQGFSLWNSCSLTMATTSHFECVVPILVTTLVLAEFPKVEWLPYEYIDNNPVPTIVFKGRPRTFHTFIIFIIFAFSGATNALVAFNKSIFSRLCGYYAMASALAILLLLPCDLEVTGSNHGNSSPLMRARYGWSDKSFSSLLQVVHDMLPEENTLPKSYYQAKKILCPMGMKYQKIHACPNDYILYIHEFQEMPKFPRCGVSRYKVKDDDDCGSDENSKKDPPTKVLWYLPIIPRFKRLFANRDDAKDLTWQANGRNCDGMLRHSTDSS
ncbi:hypothetical protein D0Y65_023616 [Glycine soja]|uniref:Uncharacterized protein n=1 Tax=Glycine soja TaxID=3848 RepID=A0A445IYT1_GLYSO|nr:hypothetical protein D0Y65_023616 [Glycine soja]